MGESYRKTTRTTVPGDDRHVERERTSVERTNDNALVNSLQYIVQLITGVIASILAVRFLLALFGANPNNTVVDFVYSVTAPLIAPFSTLFENPEIEQAARFEIETLLAIIAYLLIGALIIKVIGLFKVR